jgi:hypothetical protein
LRKRNNYLLFMEENTKKHDQSDVKKESSGIIVPDDTILCGNFTLLNEFSNGLSVSLPDKLFADISGVIDSQNKFIGQLEDVYGSFAPQILEVGQSLSDVLSPLSASVSDIGLMTVNAGKEFGLGNLAQKALDQVQGFSSMCFDAIQANQSIINDGLKLVGDLPSFNGYLEDVAASSRMVFSGLDEIARSTYLFPQDFHSPSLDFVTRECIFTEDEETEFQERLDNMLQIVDPELVEYRKACWATFKRKGKDYLGQSSGSMRRLVDNLLRMIATEDEVAKTEYFKNSPDAKDKNGKPTRKAKVYTILHYDYEKHVRFERLANGLLGSYDNLSSWDHIPLKEDEFVHGIFITIEGFLLSLLSEWSKYKEK